LSGVGRARTSDHVLDDASAPGSMVFCSSRVTMTAAAVLKSSPSESIDERAGAAANRSSGE
jgi:hypothetical protein